MLVERTPLSPRGYSFLTWNHAVSPTWAILEYQELLGWASVLKAGAGG